MDSNSHVGLDLGALMYSLSLKHKRLDLQQNKVEGSDSEPDRKLPDIKRNTIKMGG